MSTTDLSHFKQHLLPVTLGLSGVGLVYCSIEWSLDFLSSSFITVHVADA